MMPGQRGGKMQKIMPIVGMTFMATQTVTSILEVVYLIRIYRKLNSRNAGQ